MMKEKILKRFLGETVNIAIPHKSGRGTFLISGKLDELEDGCAIVETDRGTTAILTDDIREIQIQKTSKPFPDEDDAEYNK